MNSIHMRRCSISLAIGIQINIIPYHSHETADHTSTCMHVSILTVQKMCNNRNLYTANGNVNYTRTLTLENNLAISNKDEDVYTIKLCIATAKFYPTEILALTRIQL